MAAFKKNMALGESHIIGSYGYPTSPRPKIYEGTVKGLPYIGQGLQPLMRHFGGLAAGRHRICEAAGRCRLHVLSEILARNGDGSFFNKTTSEHPQTKYVEKHKGKIP